MVKIKIEGIDGADGTFDLDETYFTNRELHTIKKVSGLRVGELEEAFASGDNDVVVAMALIALTRAGKQVPVDVLWDAPSGKITIASEVTVEGDVAVPPAPLPNVPGSSSGDDARTPTSGEGSSSTGDDRPVTHLRSTGTQG